MVCPGASETAVAQAPPNVDWTPGTNIQRTLWLLANSTPQHRHTVKIVFYGQSITTKAWTDKVADDLKQRFPDADLLIENRAISGFAADKLVNMLRHDIYGFYPDLIILQDYGSDADYEKLVTEIRRHVSSEILLQNNHVHITDDQQWHDQHSFQVLPDLARKLGCGFANIRGPWKEYLAGHNASIQSLLKDSIHLNDQGCALMAQLVEENLVELPATTPASWQERVHSYIVGKDVQWTGGKLTLPFTGNRADVLAGGGGKTLQVRIDGKKPSEIADCYTYTRPDDKDSNWPWDRGCVTWVTWQNPLVAETWRLHVTESSGKQCSFEVSGSKTGPDGNGTSDSRFVSRSGRVVIEPRAWFTDGAGINAGQIIEWQSQLMGVDQFTLEFDPTRDNATTVVQGLSNEEHTLELTTDDGSPAPIAEIRVFTPSVK